MKNSDKTGCGHSCYGRFEGTFKRDGVPIGPSTTANSWLYSTGFGIRKLQRDFIHAR